MIGLVLVTHGRLADEFRNAMEHVVGKQRNLETVCVGPDDDMEAWREQIRAAMRRVETGDGVVLVTDMLGGTPSNLATSVMGSAPDEVEVLAGMNLPMLVKLAKVRSSHPLADAVRCAEAAGQKYITRVSGIVLHDCGRVAS